MSKRFHVYLLRCADGTLYAGATRDIEGRVKLHNTGRGAKYTSGRRPVELVYAEELSSWGEALRREHEIKGWSRARKTELIAPGEKTPASAN